MLTAIRPVRFRDQSSARRRLITLFQELGFGRVQNLAVRDGNPILDPSPMITREIKFAAENGVRPEAVLDDFALKAQHLDLFRLFDDIRDGVIAEITVRHGLPFTAEIAE